MSLPHHLLEQAKQGNQEAFGELYEQYLTPVYRYIYLRVLDRSIAEDLAQTVFLKVFQNLDKFTPSPDHDPLAYFFTVARNTVIDHSRKHKPVPLEDYEDTLMHSDNPAHNAHISVSMQQIYTVLEQLPEEHQEVIRLRFFGELSSEEVGKLLGKTSMAVRQMQARALKKIKGLLPRDTF